MRFPCECQNAQKPTTEDKAQNRIIHERWKPLLGHLVHPLTWGNKSSASKIITAPVVLNKSLSQKIVCSRSTIDHSQSRRVKLCWAGMPREVTTGFHLLGNYSYNQFSNLWVRYFICNTGLIKQSHNETGCRGSIQPSMQTSLLSLE